MQPYGRRLPLDRRRLTQQERKAQGAAFAGPQERIAMMQSIKLGIAATVALALWTGTNAGGEKKGHGDDKHVVVRPDDIQWGPAPPALPPGAKAAVLFGDPSKAAPYVIRAKLPDG